MKSSEAATNVVALARHRPRRRAETEFLPAALEIIETPASPVGRAIAGTIIAFVVVSIGWAALGTIDIIATAQGRIIPTGKSKLIQPFETGVVRAILVADGQEVKVGDVLVELDPTSDASDERRLAFGLAQDRLDIARLQALLRGDVASFAVPPEADSSMALMARSQMEAQASEQTAKVEGIARQVAQKTAEGREVKAAIEKIEADLPLIGEQRDIRSSLLQNQYGSRLAYLQIQQQLVESQHELDGQRQRQEENVQALAALDRQREGIIAEYRKGLLTDLAKAEVQANEHSQDVAKALQKRTLRTLRSPVDGTVQQLAVHTLGGIVTPAQQLMVIVPKDAKLEIEATLANRDVGFVHPGQDVEIKVEAFTFTRYGLIHGTVTNVSQDSIDPEAGSERRDARKQDDDGSSDEKTRQSGQASYVAHVAVGASGLQTEQGFARLEPGMAVTTEIKTGTRTILGFLLSPLKRMQNESFKER